MFDLEVEMSTDPVVDERRFDVTRGDDLSRDPIVVLVVVDVHR